MNGKRLLVIDDDQDMRDFIREVAEDCGYEVATSSTPDEFKRTYGSLEPDLIIVDLAMPEGNGVELLSFLAERGCKAPVLILSGHERSMIDLVKTLAVGLGLPAVTTLRKPVRPAELRAALGAEF